jgi:hypothetical protein
MRSSRFAFAAAALLTLAACSGQRPLPTDGSAEAAIVARWLSDGDEGLVRPGAVLVESDYSVALSLDALRAHGPDSDPDCQRAGVARSGTSVRASWDCRKGSESCPRQVDFILVSGQISSVHTNEAMIVYPEPVTSTVCDPLNRR